MSGNDLKKEFGDYQTPEDFANSVCRFLYSGLKIRPEYIVEPTSGIGNFIKASLKNFIDVKKIIGIEINKKYCDEMLLSIKNDKVQINCSNFFDYDLSKHVKPQSETLLVGNPPWATNAELKYNLPEKINFRKLSGIDAITGSSNFDICEYIILRLIKTYRDTNTVIAMLCKTSVARNVFQELNRISVQTEYIKMINFNASKVFGISAAACLLIIKLSEDMFNTSICEVSNMDEPLRIIDYIQYKNGMLSSLNNEVKDLDGICQLEWRQGVKHDCSSIMELEKKDDFIYRNKKREEIKLESSMVFPLIKSSSFKVPIICLDFKKFVIVTQKKAREDTSYIEKKCPLIWRYLNEHKDSFDNRKSSIYRGAPPFSMFGVGDYSYAKYKVGVSGFYKKPLFSLIYNKDDVNHPVMLDDTCYFLSFDSYDMAYVCMLLLNSQLVQNFLYSISFKDAKRPYTKKILKRLDLKKCVNISSIEALTDTEKRLGLQPYITLQMYCQFCDILMNK